MSGTTSSFRVAGGQIVDPSGQPFVARGINIRSDQFNAVAGNATNSPLLNYFPGTNMVRLYFEGSFSESASEFASAIQTLTAKGIVVEIEDHTGISKPPYTGSQLAAEQAWYTDIATTYKNNPYVWFGTFNEPGNGTNLAGIAAQELTTYNTIRATGNNNPILMEEPSGGNPGLVGVNAKGYDGAGPMTPSNYAGMHNIIWDLHYYGWVSGYSTNQATVNAALQGSASGASGIAGAQTITSADGTVPVIIGEFGNSTTGGAIDPNGNQVIQAVASSGKGFLAWAWNPDEQGDQAVTDSGQLTAYGKQIANIIGTTPAKPPTGTPTPTPGPTPTPAPTGSNEITTTSGGTLTDNAGNKWTLTTAGIVNENGAAVPGGSGTGALAIVNNVIYGQDAATKAWYIYNTGSRTWSTSSAPVLTPTPTPAPSPTPTPAPTPTPSPTPQQLTPTSGGTLTDNAGNKWTLTTAGMVDENGAAVPGGSGTGALAIVNNVIYGQDAATKAWYTYNTSSKTWSKSSAPVITTPTAASTVSLGETTPQANATIAVTPTADPSEGPSQTDPQQGEMQLVNSDQTVSGNNLSYLLSGSDPFQMNFVNGSGDRIVAGADHATLAFSQTIGAQITDRSSGGLHLRLDPQTRMTVVNNFQDDPQGQIDIMPGVFTDMTQLANSLQVVPGYGTILGPQIHGPNVMMFPGDYDVKVSQFHLMQA
jgi:hypothetical protein